MTVRQGLSALTGVLLCSMQGCVTPPTELVVVIEATFEVPREINELTVTVEGDTRRAFSTTVPFVTGTPGFPITFGLRPAEGETGSVRITLTGLRGTTERLSRLVRTSFVRNQRRLLVIRLDLECLDRACGGDTTCTAGSCTSPDVDPTTLPIYDGLLPDAGPRDAGTDARNDAGPDAAPDARSCEGDAGAPSPGCTLRHPPPRPRCGNDGDDGMARTFALLDPLLTQPGETWRTYGYDLDGICTDPLARTPEFECTTSGGIPPTDGLEGIDNTLGAVATTAVTTFFPDYDAGVVRALRAGTAAPLLHVTGWNGEADDVAVDVVVAFAVDVLPAGTSVPAGGLELPNSLPAPRWDGTDTAYPSATYFTSPPSMTLPLIHDDAAYVVDHTLVISLPDRAPIDIGAHTVDGGEGILRIRLTESQIVARLSSDGRSIENATVVGRWARSDVLAYLDDLGICPGMPVLDTFLTAFNGLLLRGLDLRSSPPSPGPSAPCDAMSLAIPFQASSRVIWGAVQPLELTPGDCP